MLCYVVLLSFFVVACSGVMVALGYQWYDGLVGIGLGCIATAAPQYIRGWRRGYMDESERLSMWGSLAVAAVAIALRFAVEWY